MKQKLYIVIKGNKNNVERESREWMQQWTNRMELMRVKGKTLKTNHGNTIHAVGREEDSKHPYIP